MKRTFKYLFKPIKYLFKNKLFNLNKSNFEFWFKICNKMIFHWKIEVKFYSNKNIYQIIDSNNEKLYISRARRVKLYKNGIKNRLDLLLNQYLFDFYSVNEGDIVIDVGANIGEFSYFMMKYNKASVIAIEPEELEFECLKLNLNSSSINLINKALWSKEKEMTFFQKGNTADSSLFETRSFENKKIIKTTTLSSVLSKVLSNGETIKLLKLEAEGAEPEILLGCLDKLNLIKYIVADVGPERGLNASNTLIEVLNILNDNNFKAIKYSHQRGIILFENMHFK